MLKVLLPKTVAGDSSEKFTDVRVAGREEIEATACDLVVEAFILRYGMGVFS